MGNYACNKIINTATDIVSPLPTLLPLSTLYGSRPLVISITSAINFRIRLANSIIPAEQLWISAQCLPYVVRQWTRIRLSRRSLSTHSMRRWIRLQLYDQDLSKRLRRRGQLRSDWSRLQFPSRNWSVSRWSLYASDLFVGIYCG